MKNKNLVNIIIGILAVIIWIFLIYYNGEKNTKIKERNRTMIFQYGWLSGYRACQKNVIKSIEDSTKLTNWEIFYQKDSLLFERSYNK